MINREIVENAARKYDGEKYPELFYLHHLLILRNTKEINELVSRAVKYLFLWKLGKVRSRQTPHGSQLKFSDTKGRWYYSTPITESHDRVITKAIQEERLKVAIAFRDGRVNYDEFKAYASELTSSTIVLPSFYVHMWCPFQYPVFDKKVWMFFRVQKGRSVSRYSKPSSWNEFEVYTDFFKGIVNNTGLDWRTVDCGLWVLGGDLRKTLETQDVVSRKDGEVISSDVCDQKGEFNMIPSELLDKVCSAVNQYWESIPFKHRGIKISRELIKITMELLNAEPTKELPQNCRNDVKERTPDGLDRRIKENLNSDLRTANIISDVLKSAGIVDTIPIRNLKTGRSVKGTKLVQEWGW